MNKKLLIPLFIISILLLSFGTFAQTLDDSKTIDDSKEKINLEKQPLDDEYSKSLAIESSKTVEFKEISELKDYKRLYKDKNNSCEVQFNSFKERGDVNDVILKEKYASLKGFKSDEPIKVRMYTGDHNVTYDIKRHPDFNVNESIVKEEGKIIAYDIVSDNGYITYYTDGFSTQVALLPDIRVSSKTGNLGTSWLEIHEYYTSKPVELISLPDNTNSQSYVFYPESDYDVQTHTIDGIDYELVQDSSRTDFFSDVLIQDIQYYKDLYILYEDGDYEFVNLGVTPQETLKYFDIPNYEILDSGSVTYYIPYYFRKSPETNGYNYISGIRIWKDDATRTGEPDVFLSYNNEITNLGDATYTDTEYELELNEHEELKIRGLSSGDTDLYITLSISNSFISTSEEFSVSISSTATPPSGTNEIITESASSIEYNSATLNAQVDSDGTSIDYGFRYRKVGASSWFTINKGTTTSGLSYSHTLNFLEPETTYEFQAIGNSDTQSFSGSELTFTTTAEPIENPPYGTASLNSVQVFGGIIKTIDLTTYYENFDDVGITFNDPDNPQTAFLSMPTTGSNTFTSTLFDLSIDSTGVISIDPSFTDAEHEITLVLSNEYGSIEDSFNLILNDGETASTGGLLDGLISYYDGSYSSLTALDVHGANDGTASNSRVLGGTGKLGDGFDFTGGDDYVDTNYIPDVTNTD